MLRVSYSGSKTWRVLYYENGKPRYAKIGAFPDVGVKQAYVLAHQFDVKEAGKKANAGTFREVAEDFIASYVDVEDCGRNPRSSAASIATSIPDGARAGFWILDGLTLPLYAMASERSTVAAKPTWCWPSSPSL